jgi:hypothetical protein
MTVYIFYIVFSHNLNIFAFVSVCCTKPQLGWKNVTLLSSIYFSTECHSLCFARLKRSQNEFSQ